MMSIEEIRDRLRDRNLSTVATKAHVSYWALARFANGTTERVDYRLVEALREYLREQGISGNPVD